MAASVWVVEALDAVEDLEPRLVARFEPVTVHAIFLIVAITDSVTALSCGMPVSLCTPTVTPF
jgi:hypothetical protein